MNYKLLKVIGVVIIFFLLFIFNQFSNSISSSFENVFYLIKGQSVPDSNIVLITISENDIAQIGPWPIKRSYYALLIKKLTGYKVKKIGIEIFLSSRFSSQSIYDNLLTREIQESGEVVLSSVAGQVNYEDGKFFTDSLSYPSPRLIDNSIPTGHLNYIDDNGIYIPLVIENMDNEVEAFSYQLFGANYPAQEIKVNFLSSWEKFKHYSFLEFFQKVQKNDNKLKELKDKIVIVGITDPQFASTNIETSFDNMLPGLALHAFALDNLINDRPLNYYYILPSKIIFIILIFGFIIFTSRKENTGPLRFYLFSSIIVLSISFLLFTFFRMEISYSFFIIPFLLIFLIDLIRILTEKEAQIEESLILKKLLSNKEKELTELQKLNLNQNAFTNSYLDKIESLKSEIKKLKEKDEDKVEAVQSDKSGDVHNFYGIVYRSKRMASIVDTIKKTAPENANVLVLGESGTGKELAARAIHELSSRKENNFVAVNCGALPDSLLESELFGHVKGAFTGAIADKVGRFEAADKGTIFLDEIAETSLNFQVKLLRVIQTGNFEKVGSSKTFHSDLRIVAATNKNLETLILEKQFREDLYYRLNVIKIELPPLRERKEDIEILVGYFLSKENDNIKISQAILNALEKYEWKGNIRELEAVIKRGAIFAKSSGRNMIQLSDLPDEIVKNVKFDFEDLVLKSLRNKDFSHSSINETAKELGNVNRTVISENFRGIAFKNYVHNNFDIDNSVKTISNSEDELVNDRIKSKLQTFLNNVEKDLSENKEKEFDEIKRLFNSKYKNLPQKFHIYLDEIIKKKMTSR